MPRALALSLLSFTLLAATLSHAADGAKSGGPDMATAQGEHYNGPKARVAVNDFEDKMSSSNHYRAEYGRGMRDMLTTALFQTNRYIVLEREKLQAVVQELRHGTSDLFRKDATATLGELEGADLLVTAAVTGFDPGVSGAAGNLGGTIGGLLGGSTGRTIGSMAGGFSRARVAMDLRVIEVRTGRLLAATNTEGTATTFTGAGAAGGAGAGGAGGGALGGFLKTPMESALREMIGKAVAFVVARTPETFYRFGPDGKVITVAAAANMVPVAPGPLASKAAPLIRADVDRALLVQLDDVKLRGAVISVVVSLTLDKGKAESEPFELNRDKSHVMDYATGEIYPIITLDGFTSGRLKAGDVKTLRVTFRAPKDAKTVGISLSGFGSFDDVSLAP